MIQSIDTLKAITSLWIVSMHLVYLVGLDIPAELKTIVDPGGSGVFLFFIISGFTIYLSLSRNADIKRFYIRRFLRIAPLFYIMIIITIISLNGKFQPPAIKEVLLNILFLFNFSPEYFKSIVWAGWTVGVEMCFYLVAPLIFLHINNLNRSLIFAGAAITFSAILPYSSSFVRHSIFYCLHAFAIGIVIYFIYQRFPKIKHRAVLALLPIIPIAWLFNQRTVAFGLLLIALLVFPIGGRITNLYGKISYSTYLIHPLLIYKLSPIYFWIYHLGLGHIISYVFCFSVTLVVLTPLAWLSHKFIEQHSLGHAALNRTDART